MISPDSSPLISSWRDSRRAARRLYRAARRRPWVKLAALLAVVAGSAVVWQRAIEPLLPSQRLVLLIFLIAIGLWVTEAIPPFAVGLLIIGYLVFALGTDLILDEPWDVSPYVDTWSSSVIWLMLGGFFLAEGLARTGLDRRLFQWAIRPAGGEPQRVLLAVMLTTAVASMFLSNTSTTALMIGAITPLIHAPDRDLAYSKALLLGVPIAASVGGMGTIIGSPPNAIAVGVVESTGTTLDFVEWMAFGVPVALTLVLVAWRFLSHRYPAAADHVDLDLGANAEPELPELRDRAIVITIAVVTVLLWLTTPLHGIPVAAISLLPIVGLTITPILGVAQVRALPWDTLMLVAGGLSLGAAIVDVGLVQQFVGRLEFLTGLQREAVLFGALALLTVGLSNFMSNTAAVSVLLPVAVALVPGREVTVSVILGLSASCALLLPVSTPPNAIAYSTGAVDAADFRPGGLLVGLLGPVLIVLWVSFVLVLIA